MNLNPATRPMRFRFLVLPLFLFALLYPILAFDIVNRLAASTARQDTGNFALLVFYQVTCGVWGVAAVLLAGAVALRSGYRRDMQALVCCILFAAAAYGMSFATGGYAGFLQERLVTILLDLGMKRAMISALLAYGTWPLWFAVGALVRFAVLFPEPLSPDLVRASGAHDRAGAMRSVPGAGLDVGEAFRALVARGLEHDWFAPRTIIVASSAGALLSVLVKGSRTAAVLWVPLAIGVAIAVTALRAAWSADTGMVRARLRRFGYGAVGSVAFFLAAGAAGAVMQSAAGAILVVILMTLAPAPLLAGLAAVGLPAPRATVTPAVSADRGTASGTSAPSVR